MTQLTHINVCRGARMIITTFLLCFTSFTVQAQTIINATLVHEYFNYPCTALTSEGNMVYCVVNELLFSLDASNPESPCFLDTLDWGGKAYPPPYTEYCLDLYAKSGYLYMLSRYQGLIIIDATNPSRLNRIDTVATPNTSSPLQDIRGWDHYIATSDNGTWDLYDISSPLAPKYLCRYNGSQSVSSGGFIRPAYCAQGDTLFIMNAIEGYTDSLRVNRIYPNGSISFLANVDITGFVTAVDISGAYIFATHSGCIEDDNRNSLKIYAVNESLSVIKLSSLTFYFPVSEIRTVENYIYCLSSMGGGFFVIDASDPENPKLVAEYMNTLLSTARHMVVLGKYVYFNSDVNGLNVVRIEIPTQVETNPLPSSLSLSPAYPNPFTNSTNITYTLPSRQYITLEVYDMLGRKLQSLYSGIQETGKHTVRLTENNLLPGSYYVRLTTTDRVISQLVVLSK